jgi:hypothetical protein
MTPLPNGPWEKLAADICGPFPSGEYLFVLVDYYSRFPVVEILRSITAKDVVNCLNKTFSVHGLPLEITTDNGPQFIAQEFVDYFKANDIKHHRVIPFWPSANGEVERFNRVLKKAIQTAHIEEKDWKYELYNFLLVYRTTPHCTTGETPAKLLMNRPLRNRLPGIVQNDHGDGEIQNTDTTRKQKIKSQADKRRKPIKAMIQVGDLVLVRQRYQNKLSTNFEKHPYRVEKVNGPSITVKSQNGKLYRRHISHLKQYNRPPNASVNPQTVRNSYLDDIDLDFYGNVDINILPVNPNGNIGVEEVEPVQNPNDHHIRPQRNCQPPVRYNDYHMNHVYFQ